MGNSASNAKRRSGAGMDGGNMETLLTPLEFRQDETRESPGLLSGVLITYGSRAGDRAEMFEDGAFYWDAAGIVINEQHDRRAAIVRTVPRLEGRAVRIDVALPNTTRGRDVATAMQGPNPLYSGFSAEFRAEKETRRNGLRVITRAYLGGVGLVDTPSYRDSTVEVRGESQLVRPKAVTLWL